MSWIQIAPGISINANIPLFAGNPVVQQAQSRQTHQAQLAQQQARSQAAQQQQMAQYAQRLTRQRATGNAALTSLRILGAGPNRTGAQARVSRNQSRKKKRTTASLRLGSQSSQGGGGGLNIAM